MESGSVSRYRALSLTNLKRSSTVVTRTFFDNRPATSQLVDDTFELNLIDAVPTKFRTENLQPFNFFIFAVRNRHFSPSIGEIIAKLLPRLDKTRTVFRLRWFN